MPQRILTTPLILHTFIDGLKRVTQVKKDSEVDVQGTAALSIGETAEMVTVSGWNIFDSLGRVVHKSKGQPA